MAKTKSISSLINATKEQICFWKSELQDAEATLGELEEMKATLEKLKKTKKALTKEEVEDINNNIVDDIWDEE